MRSVLYCHIRWYFIIIFNFLYFHSFKIFNLRFLIEKNIKSLFSLTPLLLLHSSYYLFLLTDRFFVTFLDTGDISALTYATVLTFCYSTIIEYGNIFFNSYSEEKKTSEKNRKFNEALSLSILIGANNNFFYF